MTPTYVNKYDTTEDLKDGGIFLLNCPWSAEELEERLPAKMKRDLANKHANFYIMDATKLARDLGLGNRINTILQAAFFQLTKVIPIDLAVEEMKQGNYNSYFKKGGQEIVDLNNRAVDVGLTGMTKVEVPPPGGRQGRRAGELKGTDFVKEIVVPMDRQHGDKLPVSLFKSTTAWTAPGRMAPPHTPSGAWLSRCPSGIPTCASSATAVPWRVPTRPSGPCC